MPRAISCGASSAAASAGVASSATSASVASACFVVTNDAPVRAPVSSSIAVPARASLAAHAIRTPGCTARSFTSSSPAYPPAPKIATLCISCMFMHAGLGNASPGERLHASSPWAAARMGCRGQRLPKSRRRLRGRGQGTCGARPHRRSHSRCPDPIRSRSPTARVDVSRSRLEGSPSDPLASGARTGSASRRLDQWTTGSRASWGASGGIVPAAQRAISAASSRGRSRACRRPRAAPRACRAASCASPGRARP